MNAIDFEERYAIYFAKDKKKRRILCRQTKAIF